MGNSKSKSGGNPQNTVTRAQRPPHVRGNDFNDFDRPSVALRAYAVALGNPSTTDSTTASQAIARQYQQGNVIITNFDSTQTLAEQEQLLIKNLEKLLDSDILRAEKLQLIKPLVEQARVFIQHCYDAGGETNMKFVGNLYNVHLFVVLNPLDHFPNDYLSKEERNLNQLSENWDDLIAPQKISQIKIGFSKWNELNVEQRALLFAHSLKVFEIMCKKDLPFSVFTTIVQHHFGPRNDLQLKFTFPNEATATLKKIPTTKTEDLKEFITCVCNNKAVNKYILGTAPQTGQDFRSNFQPQ